MSAKEEALKEIEWNVLKQRGSDHYKTDGGVQPIDLYRSMGILRGFAIASIIKYAARNCDHQKPVSARDMSKIKHYADLLIAACGE